MVTNLGALYQFELKKILGRKIVWFSVIIALFVFVLSMGASLIGSYYVDGVMIDTNYHMFQVDKAYQQRLDGRLIDQRLLEEMQEAYRKIPSMEERYSITEEYQTYARPYSVIFNFVRQTTGMSTAEVIQWIADEQDMYAKRQTMLEEIWKDYFLTQKEKEFWRAQEEKLERPVVFRYKEGYWQLFDCLNTVGLMNLVVITICLSGVFTEEHVRKTDQLILSSKYGRKTIYWAKFLAGVSFSFLLSLLFTVTAFISAFVLYGSEGFSAAFQLIYGSYSYSLHIGEAILISYSVMGLAGILTGIFAMMLSEMLHSSIATLSIIVGTIIFTMFFNIPDQYRILSQLWSYLPSEYVAVWNIFNPQTIVVFGKILVSWQIVPILYAFLGGVFAFGGKRTFMRYQVSGR